MVMDAASAQHRMVDRRRRAVGSVHHRPIDVLLPLAAQDLLESGAHLLVPVWVDDRIHSWVELGKEQEELLIVEDSAAGAEDIEKYEDQAWGPTDDKGT